MNGSFRTGNAALFLCSAFINANSMNRILLIRHVLKDRPNVLESLRQFGDASDPSSLKKKGQEISLELTCLTNWCKVLKTSGREVARSDE